MAAPLQGIRVLDLSRILAGPWCTQILADLGAEVIKIERPGRGDDTRHWGPPWLDDGQGQPTKESSYYLSANRGKHSVTIDITDPAGRDLVLRLAESSDIFIENFKRGSLTAKGLGYEQLKAINPGIIYLSITGFGQTGPLADDPGYDYLAQGMGGLMSITGVPDGEPGAGPQRVGVAVGDLTTGMMATVGLLAALHHRSQTGEGQYIDISLLDTQVSWLANQASNYFVGGKVPTRTGSGHPNLAPYQNFESQDGSVIIAVGNDDQFVRFCEAVGQAEWIDDPRFRTNPDRVQNRLELAELVTAITKTKTSQQWMNLLRPLQIPCGPINNLAEVFESEQVKHRGLQIELPHSAGGTVTGVANPLKFSETQVTYNKAPPMLGEDTHTILTEVLGLTEADLTHLKNSKII